MSETKKLISNLKKEIEKLEKGCGKTNENLELVMTKDGIFDIAKCGLDYDENKRLICEECRDKIIKKQAQLQFAEKLMKLRDKEEKERLKKLIEKIKKDVEKLRPRWEAREKGKKVKRIGQEINIKELNKILNSALKKCQK